MNYRWICERFIDYPEPDNVSQNERMSYKRSLCGVRGKKDGVVGMNISLQLPYFYLLPKVYKTPCTTRPVVSGVSSELESLSKWVDILLQRVEDSWHFLNEIRDLKDLEGCTLVTSDAKVM